MCFVDVIYIASLNTVTFEIHLTNPCKVVIKKIIGLLLMPYIYGMLVSVTVRLIALICLKLLRIADVCISEIVLNLSQLKQH